MKQGWACWDSLLWRVGCGSEEDLKDWVANPERLIALRQNTVISMSDQIPVWIKADGERCLVSRVVSRERRLAKRQRTSRKAIAAGEEQTEQAQEQPQTTVRAAGNPANSRYRVTLVARQIVLNYFRPEADPVGW